MSDLISRAELIKHFKTFDEKYLTLDTIYDEVQSAPSASLPQGDLISRAELLEKMLKEAQRYANDDIRHGYHNCECLVYDAPSVSAHRPTVDKCDGCLYEDSDKSLFPCNYCKRNYFDKYEKDESNYITESPNDVVEKNDEVIERPIIEHDREWIIGCIEHDGFIHTHRFDKANQIIHDALSADTSSDLISRANAIRWVKTECNPYGKPTLDYDSGLKFIEHLKKMPSELPSAGDDWIPCSERLPERDELVLVTYKTTDKIHLCKYIDDGSENPWWSYIDDCCACNNVVIAWMPLPKPYRGGDDE